MIKGKQKLPEWFDGELYKEGGVVSNPYSGEKIELDNIEYGIEYDGRVYAENIELQHNSDLIEAIVEKVSKIFTEMEAPEDDDTELLPHQQTTHATHIKKEI